VHRLCGRCGRLPSVHCVLSTDCAHTVVGYHQSIACCAPTVRTLRSATTSQLRAVHRLCGRCGRLPPVHCVLSTDCAHTVVGYHQSIACCTPTVRPLWSATISPLRAVHRLCSHCGRLPPVHCVLCTDCAQTVVGSHYSIACCTPTVRRLCSASTVQLRAVHRLCADCARLAQFNCVLCTDCAQTAWLPPFHCVLYTDFGQTLLDYHSSVACCAPTVRRLCSAATIPLRIFM
jgi:hypothetical protein